MEPTEQITYNESLTASTPPDPGTYIQCKHCNRHFATISGEGGFVPVFSQAQACASCEPFLGLHETLQTREEEHKVLLDRGPKHHGRALAHDNFRNARVKLENFLISIGVPNEATFDVARAGFANRADPAQPARTDNTAEAQRPDDSQRDSRGGSPQAIWFSLTKTSPIAKRSFERDPGAASLERKRIKFTESVEERPEYRTTGEFYRGGKEYIPGRYVVAEGFEYLDTSGSTLTFTKFTGQKKVGSTFVDVVRKDEPRENGDGVPAVKSKGKGSRKRQQGGQEDVEGERKDFEPLGFGPERKKDNDQTSSRELRNIRRSRSTTPPVTTRPRRKVAQYDGQDDGAQNRSHLKSSLTLTMKTPFPVKEGVSADKEESTHAPKHEERLQELSRETDRSESTREAAELANMNQAVTNLQRELSSLQQTTVTPRYRRIVSTAICGILEVLEPLKKLFETRPGEREEVERVEDAIEDDSVYFDALNVTDKAVLGEALHSAEALEKVEDSHRWTDAAGHNEAVGEANASLVFDVNGLDTTPIEVGQSMSTASALETAGDDHKHGQWFSVPSVEAGLEKALGNTTCEGITESSTTTKRESVEPRGHTSRSHNLPGSSTIETRSREVTPQPNGTISDDEEPIQWDPETPVEVTLQVSPSEVVRNEAAGDLHQSVGELINGQAEKQGVQAHCESEASNGSPNPSNVDQDPEITSAGSGSDPDLSADPRVESDIESFDGEMLGANEHSSRSP